MQLPKNFWGHRGGRAAKHSPPKATRMKVQLYFDSIDFFDSQVVGGFSGLGTHEAIRFRTSHMLEPLR